VVTGEIYRGPVKPEITGKIEDAKSSIAME
jgi:hypothetical protein